MNYITEARHILIDGIDKNKTLDVVDKDMLKDLVLKQLQIIGQYVGMCELFILRERQHKENAL